MDYKTQVSEEQFKKDLIEMWFEEKSLKFFDKVTEYVKSVEIEEELDLMTKIKSYKLDSVGTYSNQKGYYAYQVDELIALYKELTEQVKKCFICDHRKEVNCSHCALEPTKDWLSKEG